MKIKLDDSFLISYKVRLFIFRAKDNMNITHDLFL